MATSESLLTERALWATALSVGLLLPLGGCPGCIEYGYKPTDEGAPDTAGPPGEPDEDDGECDEGDYETLKDTAVDFDIHMSPSCYAEFPYPCGDAVRGLRIVGSTAGDGELPTDDDGTGTDHLLYIFPPSGCGLGSSITPAFYADAYEDTDLEQWIWDYADLSSCAGYDENTGDSEDALNCSQPAASLGLWRVQIQDHSSSWSDEGSEDIAEACLKFGTIQASFYDEDDAGCDTPTGPARPAPPLGGSTGRAAGVSTSLTPGAGLAEVGATAPALGSAGRRGGGSGASHARSGGHSSAWLTDMGSGGGLLIDLEDLVVDDSKDGRAGKLGPLPVAAAAHLYGRTFPASSSCRPGSGRFSLLPLGPVHDGHREASAILMPVQVSGTGSMTGEAWITRVGVVDNHGALLSVAESPRLVSTDGSSRMLRPVTLALPPAPETLSLAPGLVGGDTRFIVEGSTRTSLMSYEVDLEWTCEAAPGVGSVPRPAGFSISLAELGCVGDWPQRLTLRPSGRDGLGALQVEPYGMNSPGVHVKLWDLAPRQRSFAIQERGLSVSGRLLFSDEGLGPLLALDEANISGIPVCDPGLYELLPEHCTSSPCPPPDPSPRP